MESTDEKSVQKNSQDSQDLHVKDDRDLLTQFVKQECEKVNENNGRSSHQVVEPSNTSLGRLQNGNSVNIVQVAGKQTDTLSGTQSSSSCRDHNTPEDRKKSIQVSHHCDNEPMDVTSPTNNTIKEQKPVADEQSKSGNLEKSSENIKIRKGPDNLSAATETPVEVTNFVSFF